MSNRTIHMLRPRRSVRYHIHRFSVARWRRKLRDTNANNAPASWGRSNLDTDELTLPPEVSAASSMVRNDVNRWCWTLPEGSDGEVLAPGGNP